MRTTGAWWVGAAIVLSACGSPPAGADAGDELRAVVERRADVDQRWERFGKRDPAEITVADGQPEVVAVAWLEDDDRRWIETVSGSTGCDEACVQGAEAWSLDELERGPLPRAVDDPCINCGENEYLSLVALGANGTFAAVEPSEVVSILGEIDSPYEVMLVLGRSLSVRDDGDGWRAVTFEIVSDCDPVVTRYTMWAIDRTGGQDQLAAFETSDNSCI